MDEPVSRITPEIVGLTARHVLNGLGFALIAWVARDSAQMDEWNTILQALLGGVMATVAYGWSVWQKRQGRRALVIAAGSPMAADTAMAIAAGKRS